MITAHLFRRYALPAARATAGGAAHLLREIGPERRELRELRFHALQIMHAAENLGAMGDAELAPAMDALRQRVADGEEPRGLEDEALALGYEAVRRTLTLEPHQVQVMGALALRSGTIAEMKTGEGKTITAALALIAASLDGKGIHLITANDYLAYRDAEALAPVYAMLGLSVGVLQPDSAESPSPAFVYNPENGALRAAQRGDAYRCDITYGTASEFGFDYLRDVRHQIGAQIAQRGQDNAIVDEADSVLIDEAVTPLVLSDSSHGSAVDKYVQYAEIVAGLSEGAEYVVNLKQQMVTLTNRGWEAVKQATGIFNFHDPSHIFEVHHLEAALQASLFKKDEDYLVDGGEIVPIDNRTGRPQPGRRWEDGAHEALEAKEGLRVQRPTQSVASISIQAYFGRYKNLAGMTGTARAAKDEFADVYGLRTVCVPTNEPELRDDQPDKIYATHAQKLTAIVNEIERIHKTGRPILVGTANPVRCRELSALLARRGIAHVSLDTENLSEEAEIIARAGRRGAITVATNVAGRGTDIVLGGGDELEHAAVVEMGGLHVIGTERNASGRVDDQLRGRAGRQGDPGSSRFFASLEDEIFDPFGHPQAPAGKMARDGRIDDAGIVAALNSAQERTEARQFEGRKRLMQFDVNLNLQRDLYHSEREKLLGSADPHLNITEFIRELTTSVVMNRADGAFVRPEKLPAIVEDLTEFGPQLKINVNSLPDHAEQLAQNLSRRMVAAYEKMAREVASTSPQWSQADQKTPQQWSQVERKMLLSALDDAWGTHLAQTRAIRRSVELQVTAQRDPVVEHVWEAHHLWEETVGGFKLDAVRRMKLTLLEAQRALAAHRANGVV